jgi:hypothetical protein
MITKGAKHTDPKTLPQIKKTSPKTAMFSLYPAVRKKPLGNLRNRLVDNIKIDIKEINGS